MLYHLIYPLSQHYTFLNVFRYITLRSFISFFAAITVAIIWGRFFIRSAKKRQFGQVIRDDGPSNHLKKAGTPTFGGIFIMGGILSGLFLSGNWTNINVLAALFVMIGHFFLGLTDDYLKVLKKNTDGLSAKKKLLGQFSISFVACSFLYFQNNIDTHLYFPFAKGLSFDIGISYLFFGPLVIVASSNAVNLTDGLDGLAIGPIIISAATLGLLAYVTGHKEIATYLYIPYVEGASELAVLAAAIVGASVGFLWYNAYPAQVFMGDVGSLSLGGVLGTLAVLTKNEILFILIGGIFVVEALSVIIQVVSFRLRGKRVFRMAPLHHHFELYGWPEPKVIVRFWIISIVLAILSIATLKLR